MTTSTMPLAASDFHGWRLVRPGAWLVRFGAPWCAWCKTIQPALERLARTRRDLSVGTFEVDEDESVLDHFQVHSLPTLILFQDGVELTRWVGARTAEAVDGWLREAGTGGGAAAGPAARLVGLPWA